MKTNLRHCKVGNDYYYFHRFAEYDEPEFKDNKVIRSWRRIFAIVEDMETGRVQSFDFASVSFLRDPEGVHYQGEKVLNES